MVQLRRLLALLLVCLPAMLAQAATINVGPGQPYPTIQSGINAASPGDTVLVAPGVYFENVDFKGKAITVTSSAGAAITIIDGGGVLGVGTVNFRSGELRTSVLSGFTVRNGAGQVNGAGGGVFVYNAAPTILNNVITANACENVLVNGGAALVQGNEISAAINAPSCGLVNGGTGVVVNTNATVGQFSHTDIIGNTIENNVSTYAGGINLMFAQGSIVQGNVIRNNAGRAAGGIYVDAAAFTIAGNLFYGNTSTTGAQPSGTTVPNGITLSISIVPNGAFLDVIAGNTIADTLQLTGFPNRLLLIDNIITSPSATIPALGCYDSVYPTPISTDHNDIYNPTGLAYANGCTNPTGTYGNLSVDPLFAASAAGNYQLTAKSPARDAGNNSDPLLSATDLAGQPRIQVASGLGYPSVDIGAYEYTGSPDTGHTVIKLTPSEYFDSQTPATLPPPLSFTITLSSPSGQPTGQVAVYEDQTLLGLVNVGSSGTATFTPGSLSSGLHSFTASYPTTGGGPSTPIFVTPATSPRFYLVVPRSLPYLALTSSPNPSVYGSPVTFTINTTATGSITLTDTSTSTLLTTFTANTSGIATYSTATLTGGDHTITAAATATSTQGAASSTITQLVSSALTQSALAISAPASGAYYAGTPVMVAATVTSTAGTPTGTVAFTANGVVVVSAIALVNGVASTSFTLPAGNDLITCTYSGDTNHASSTCAPVTINVAAPGQTITFPAPPAPAYAATSVALTASSSAGLPITYTVVSGPANVAGSTLTYQGAGTVVLQADQPGNGIFPAAAPVQQTANVTLLTEPLTALSSPISTLITFLSAGTLSSINASTQGAAGLDFNLAQSGAGPGACTAGTAYTAGQTCTVAFTFQPLHPGLRYGGITLSTSAGALLANSYLIALGTGPQVLYNPPNQTTLGIGFGGLSGVAVDGAGNVYVADYITGGVYQVSAATGATRLLNTVPADPATDISVDGSGNVFYTTRDLLAEIVAVNGVFPPTPTVRIIATGFGGSINGMKVDATGNAFIASSFAGGSNSYVKEVLAVNGVIPANPVIRTLVSGVGGPTGVAIDIAGNVYFSDEQGGKIYELVAVGGSIPATPVQRVVSAALSAPTNVSFDVSGNLYVPDVGTHDVKELLAVNLLLPASPVVVSLGAGLNTPAGVTVDSSGSLYVADLNIVQVVKLAYGSAPTLTFAATQIFTTSADSPRSVTITNGGNAPLTVPPPTAGTNPTLSAAFSLDSSSTCPILLPAAAPFGLAPGASCTTAVNFTPTVPGPISGTLVRTDNNLSIPGSTQTILLNGVGLGIPPTLVFTVPNHTFGDPPFTVAATSNSPGAISYSYLNGPATLSGNTVTLTGAGVVTLQATQAASGNYAAGSATAAFTVARKAQTITFTQPASPVAFSSTPIALSATASSGLPVSFSVVSGPGQVSGNMLTIRGGGTIVLAADQPGDSNFAPAAQVQRSVVVRFGLASVTLAASPNPSFLLNPVLLTSTVTSPAGSPGGLVIFQEGATVLGSATLNGGVATISISTLGLGSHTIIAYYLGDTNYSLATSPSVVEVIQDFSLVITNPQLTIQHGGVAVYNLVVTSVGGAGLASTIQLTFSGGPDYAQDTITPVTIATGSGTTPGTLTLHTPNFPSGDFYSGLRVSQKLEVAALFGLLLLPAAYRRKRLRGLLTLLIATLVLASASGCGSGWKTQHWNVSVTATSGALVRTAKADLTSNP